MKIALGLFAFFALVVIGATLWSKSQYGEGQGLHDSVNDVLLLQIQAVGNKELSVDIRPAAPAQKIHFAKKETLSFTVQNLSEGTKRFRLRMEYDSPMSRRAIRWEKNPGEPRELAPHASQEIQLPLELQPHPGLSKDGTLTLKVFLEPIS